MVKKLLLSLLISSSALASYSPSANIFDSDGNSLSSTAGALNSSCVQSGTWNLNNISGTVSLPNGAATSDLQSTINSTLGSPFQAGGSIGNSSFGATQSGTWNISNVSGTVSLPTGAATSSLQTTGNTALSTINTTLGSPFQAGGSIGNTAFGATQSGTWNINNVSGTVSLPTGASTSALQATINTTLGTPFQAGGSIGNTAFIANAGTNLNTSALALDSTLSTMSAKLPALGQTTMSGSLPVTLASDQTGPKNNTDTSSIAQNLTGTNSLTISTNGASNLTFQITGSWTGNIFPEGTIDGSNWFLLTGLDLLTYATASTISNTLANSAIFQFPVAGFVTVRLRASLTGTAVVSVTASQGMNVYQGNVGFDYVSVTGTAATSNAAIPVDSNVTGQSAQTATVNNILTTSAGAAATDLSGYRSASVQVVSTGTGGTYIFEGCNDNSNFQAIPVWNNVILTGTPITAAVTPTSSQIIYTFPLTFRYLRLRIATTITGGSIQAFSRFNNTAWEPPVRQIAQATAGNLNVAIGSGTVTTVSTVTTLANGQTANSAASTGSPLRVGGRVKTTNDTTLVSGDAADFASTTDNAIIDKPYAAPELDWTYTSGLSGIVNNTSTQMKAAGAAGIKNYVTGCSWVNTSATASTIAILDGASVIWAGNAPANMTVPFVVTFPTPLRGTAATAMNVQLTTTSTLTMVDCQGYQAP